MANRTPFLLAALCVALAACGQSGLCTDGASTLRSHGTYWVQDFGARC